MHNWIRIIHTYEGDTKLSFKRAIRAQEKFEKIENKFYSK